MIQHVYYNHVHVMTSVTWKVTTCTLVYINIPVKYPSTCTCIIKICVYYTSVTHNYTYNYTSCILVYNTPVYSIITKILNNQPTNHAIMFISRGFENIYSTTIIILVYFKCVDVHCLFTNIVVSQQSTNSHFPFQLLKVCEGN